MLPVSSVCAQGLHAEIIPMQTKMPANIKGNPLTFARAHKALKLNESKEAELNQRSWHVEFAIAFNKPPADSEISLLFYDVQDGPRRFMDSMSSYLQGGRTEKIFFQSVDLRRPKYKPNRKLEVVVTVRRQDVGSAKFGIVGEAPKRNGQVDFSDEDTKQQ
jgi:hypothetical protein